MVSRIDEGREGMPPFEAYTEMSQERLARGCSAMQRAMDQLGSVLDNAVHVLSHAVEALSGKRPSDDQEGDEDAVPCPLTDEDLQSLRLQRAVAGQLIVITLNNIVRGVNRVSEATGGDVEMDASLSSDVAELCVDLELSTLGDIFKAITERVIAEEAATDE